MKKITILGAALILSAAVFSQDIYKATTGKISFFSEAPMENIEAHNEKVRAIINTKNQEMAFIVPIVGFKFEKPLMEEHFNENYMESDKYKTGQFKGSYEGKVNYKKDGVYPVKAKGMLTIHGVEKERTFEGSIEVKGNTLVLNAKFVVKVADHDIEVPKLVVKNIAEEVDVTVNVNFEPKQ